MASIDRGRETRVLWELLDRSAQPRDRVDEIEGGEDTWTQLRLWLAYTASNEHVALRFRVNVSRPREVVSAWGGITEDLTLIHTGERLAVVREDDDENRCASECTCTPEERNAS
jgi:hypothetical protein